MNKARRKSLGELIERLEALKDEIETISSDLEGFKDEEEEYRDNMPENLTGSVRYEAADNAISEMEYALSSLEEISDSINDAIGNIENATE